MKSTKDVPGIKRHGDKKHFHINRVGMRRAEALIERKWLFFFHAHICDGHTIFNKTVSYPRLLLILHQVKTCKLV